VSADYQRVARPLGITGVVVVEASPLPSDTRWVLQRLGDGELFLGYVASLEIGAPDFLARLEQIAVEPKVLGVRGFLWSPKLTLDQTQLSHLRALAQAGLPLELVSRRTLNPKDQVAALAAAVPELVVVIDHLGGARGREVDTRWAAQMRQLAAQPNVQVKLSSLFDMYNPALTEIAPWPAPTEAAAYRAHFELLLAAFGSQRLMFGSNWPVCNLGGTLADQIRIAEELLAPHGPAVRDQVMFENARRVYRRRSPSLDRGAGRSSIKLEKRPAPGRALVQPARGRRRSRPPGRRRGRPRCWPGWRGCGPRG
jgi:predicted TIM-barrel fold metal-dependent hydrolase